MAEFCKQCATTLDFPHSDFENICKELKNGYYFEVLCEGCGVIQVNKNAECVTSDCLHAGHNVAPDVES